MDHIINFFCENFREKLKTRIFGPVFKHVANDLVSRHVEHYLGADRIEELATTFELIHAAANPLTTKEQYADALTVFLANAVPIDIKQISKNLKNIYPENGGGRSLHRILHSCGDKTKIYVDKNGKLYVRRPTSREYSRSIRGDKAASLHEQQKIDTILECIVTKKEGINNEQICILNRPNGSPVTFIIRDNGDDIKHAELLIDGVSISINNKSQNKNDCYYNVVLIANEISQGKSFEVAMKIFDDENVVNNLRKNVSLAIENDETLLNERRWIDRTNVEDHYTSLVGLYKDSDGQLRLDDVDVTNLREKMATNKGMPKFVGLSRTDENDQAVTDHHIIPKPEIRKAMNEYMKEIPNDNVL
ncbi:unnamed protein product, partial [Rotaria sp. Silwood2]